MSLVSLFGEEVQGEKGMVKVDTLSECEQIGVYFSAHWCPPCRAFTPKLAEVYKEVNKSSKRLEIVFVSSDRDADGCASYYGDMPWLLLPFENRAKKDELASKYGVTGIPTLVLLNPKTGEEISRDGRGLVTSTEAKGFPWQ